MRPLLHLISVALVLPVLALASLFVVLGRAIAAGSALSFLDQLLAHAVLLIPWGLLAASAVLILIALGGLFVRTRWLAGLCVAILGLGSTVVVLVLTVGNSDSSLEELPFFIPGIVASSIGAWLALTERPGRGVTSRA